MESDTKVSKIRHVKDVRAELNSTTGLPFKDVLSSEKIVNALVQQSIEYRDRIFTPDKTLWTFLSQVLSDKKTCEAAVTKLIASEVANGETPPSANTAAYCKGRERLPEELISTLGRQTGRELQEEVPSKWLWRDRHLKLVDGSTISMPDTEENQKAYPQPDSQKPGVGFPIARLVAIVSCATGAVLDLALGPYSGKGTGEHGLLRELMHNFQSGDIILGDCYYCTFFLIASLMKMGVDIVSPMHGGRDWDFREGERLGKKDHLVDWKKPIRPSWMDEEIYLSYPNEITVREVEIRIETKGFRSKTRVLVTTFVDSKKNSKQDLSELYDHRWLVEVDLRSIKQTMKMDILRGKTPSMVRKEIWAHLLAYNLIRKVMAQAAYVHDKDPRKLSFSLAQKAVESFRDLNLFCESNEKLYRGLLKSIAYKTVGNRPGRQEPRRVKRRPKAFPLLQKVRHLYRKNAV